MGATLQRWARGSNTRHNQCMEKSLRGHLLIAAPSLFDYFRRTVVLVLEHNEEGAMGVVLNRPSETTVHEAVSALASLADDDEVVRVGGPLSPGAGGAPRAFRGPHQARPGGVGRPG